MATLYRDLKPGQSMIVGDHLVTLEAKSGGRARLRIDSAAKDAAPPAEKPAPTQQPAAAAGRVPFLRRPEEAI